MAKKRTLNTFEFNSFWRNQGLHDNRRQKQEGCDIWEDVVRWWHTWKLRLLCWCSYHNTRCHRSPRFKREAHDMWRKQKSRPKVLLRVRHRQQHLVPRSQFEAQKGRSFCYLPWQWCLLGVWWQVVSSLFKQALKECEVFLTAPLKFWFRFTLLTKSTNWR